MKVLLIGGAGYVGSVLTEELLERGYSVKVFDRFFFGDGGIERLKDRVEIVRGDMRELESRVLEDIGGVINLGGLSNDPTAEYNPKANLEMNTQATKLSAELCQKAGVSRLYPRLVVFHLRRRRQGRGDGTSSWTKRPRSRRARPTRRQNTRPKRSCCPCAARTSAPSS